MINALLIDDEPLALDILEEDLLKIPHIQSAKRCLSAFEALDYLRSHPIDLIFLDINMPDITGLQFLQSLSNRPMVIFTTAYPDFALDGFEWDAVDYLLKPYSFERLLKAVNKALDVQKMQQKEMSSKSNKAEENQLVSKPKNNYIFLKSDYKDVKVDFDEILYIEGMKDYVKVYLVGKNQPLITQLNVKNIEEKLSKDAFVRIHRSFIVAINKIELIQKNRIYIQKAVLPIGEFYKSRFQEMVLSTQIK